jgi:hypothetical protein
MTITAASTFNDILAEKRITATTADIAAWDTIDSLPSVWGGLITTDSLDFVASVGAFGVDMTEIHGYCYDSWAANGQNYCQYYRIYYYDGWATGIYLTLMTPTAAFTNNSAFYITSYDFYLCFDNESCIGGRFATDSVSDILGYVWCA